MITEKLVFFSFTLLNFLSIKLKLFFNSPKFSLAHEHHWLLVLDRMFIPPPLPCSGSQRQQGCRSQTECLFPWQLPCSGSEQIAGLGVRPCVSIRLSEFRVISGKCTGITDNRKKNISVHFRFDISKQQGFPFENTKMVRKFSQNRVTKMFKTPVLIYGRSENNQ